MLKYFLNFNKKLRIPGDHFTDNINRVTPLVPKITTGQPHYFITLSLGSMETDSVISEPCYNEVIYNRYITK